MNALVCVSLAYSLIQAKKQNKSADTMKQQQTQHNLPRVVKPVGVTGKMSKWQSEKRAPKLLLLCFLQNASVSQTQKHRWTSMGGKLANR